MITFLLNFSRKEKFPWRKNSSRRSTFHITEALSSDLRLSAGPWQKVRARWACRGVVLHCFVLLVFRPAQSSGSLPPSVCSPSLQSSGPSCEWELCPRNQPPKQAPWAAHHPPSPLCPGPCTCWTKAQLGTFNPFSFWAVLPQQERSARGELKMKGVECAEQEGYASNNKCLLSSRRELLRSQKELQQFLEFFWISCQWFKDNSRSVFHEARKYNSNAVRKRHIRCIKTSRAHTSVAAQQHPSIKIPGSALKFNGFFLSTFLLSSQQICWKITVC